MADRHAPVLYEDIAVLLAKDAIEPVPMQGFYSSYFFIPKKGGGLRPVQDADTQAHDQMHPAPGLVCSNRPEGRILSCFDPSAKQTVPTVCIQGSGMAVKGPPLRTLPVSPCLHKGRRGRPYPVTGSGCQGPQLSK